MKNKKLAQSDFKKISDKILKSSKDLFKILDDIDKDLYRSDDNPGEEKLKEYARKAGGAGSNLNKKLAKVSAIKLNEQLNKYLQLKVDASVEGTKFVSTVADKEASDWIKDLRLTRNILESYVESAKTIISICRLHLKDKGQSFDANL